MERKKQNIGLLVALGVAIAVFAVDRIMPGGSPVGPVTAEGAPTNEAGIAAMEPEAPSVTDDRQTQAAEVRTSLAGRLDKVARSHDLQSVVVRDAFYPSPEWVQPVGSKEQIAEANSEIHSATLKARKFAGVHKLKGVIVASGRSLAIIDGNCVYVGQKIDGFELKTVTANSAVLVCQGVEVVLNLNASGGE